VYRIVKRFWSSVTLSFEDRPTVMRVSFVLPLNAVLFKNIFIFIITMVCGVNAH
jgi:hypothetical protein